MILIIWTFILYLNPITATMSLENDQQERNLKPLSLSSVSHWHVNGVVLKHIAFKVEVL